MQQEIENLLTIEELAEYLRVKPRTIYDWLYKKKVPALKIVGQWRFRKDKIDEWLDRKEAFKLV
ncbi:MAG: helix-turn-helix domain-containing protein [Candidatus Gygaella obscura]|nr:helix-turn-helix domain-containing protein [Candidatus Gygaella obscura]